MKRVWIVAIKDKWGNLWPAGGLSSEENLSFLFSAEQAAAEAAERNSKYLHLSGESLVVLEAKELNRSTVR